MSASESARHLELKRLALQWAQRRGFRVAAAEVSVPHLRVRLDVAACRVESRSRSAPISATAIFECKQSRSDFARDSRSRARTLERMAALTARKLRHEATLRPFYLSLRHGDSLFSELDGCDFIRTGDECYLRLIAEMKSLSARLHGQTKFDDLLRWRAANLHYVVAEPELFSTEELPAGWGLLIHTGDQLQLGVKPLWHDVPEPQRLALLQRTAIAATTAANQLHGIVCNSLGTPGRPS
ncbi:MAG: hypothetical protein QOE70_3937 [Chthoniobacter sp.]|jgi:hypothetical protein|nr:hypothetical protein [Chthoniobacter sp.]